MDTSRRAVEAYWRSRMIDGVTSDEDKVAPVYKLDEVCELLRTSHSGIVKEVSDYILKRIDHKSPVVKQKALRLIKFAVGKSGVEFRREMQRHSSVIRQLFHYKGYPDPLKGDALNKAVRDTAHETVSAIFASDDGKAQTEGTKRRMEGFGNTNFEMQTEDKKSFLSEVVGLGSASIKQGLSTIAAAHSFKKNDSGTYKSPNLHRSLTTEIDSRERYEGNDHRERWTSPIQTKGVGSSWNQDSDACVDASSANAATTGGKSREERLLETIVTSGGVRLQPTRDAIHIFLMEASKLNPIAMSHALELKLQSHLWQVRMKAVCVLESILKTKDDEYFSTIGSYFLENREFIIKCSESPQASLRDKANKVLSILDGESTSGEKQAEDLPGAKPAIATPLPDLIDTGENDEYGSEGTHHQAHQMNANLMSAGSLVDDLFGGEPITNVSTGENGKEDPFADVSFHVTEDREKPDDLFSGLTVDETEIETTGPTHNSLQSELLDLFGANSHPSIQETAKTDVHDLIAGLSTREPSQENIMSAAADTRTFSGFTNLNTANGAYVSPANDALNGIIGSQMIGMNQNPFFTSGSMPYGVPSGIMLNQPLATQPINYNSMASLFSQQQLLFQKYGHIETGVVQASGTNALPLPDVFQFTNNPAQSHSTVMTSSKEETRAFDFISDHVSAARNQKRVV